MSVTSLFNDGKVNWNTRQPMAFDTVNEYIDVATKLRPALNKFLEELQQETGIELDITPACIKSKESATRKLGDHTVSGHPEKINDYLRTSGDIQATSKAETIAQTKKLIDFAKRSNRVTGYKDQISFPDAETGMRSLKLHVRVSDGKNKMDAEIIIGHIGMRKTYEATKALRSFERGFRRATCELGGKMPQKANNSSNVARGARHIIHNEAAEKVGWNDFINPEVAHLHTGRESDIKITPQTFGGAQMARHIPVF